MSGSRQLIAATENPTLSARCPATNPKKLPTGAGWIFTRLPLGYADIRALRPFASISVYIVAMNGEITPGRISPPLVTVHTS